MKKIKETTAELSETREGFNNLIKKENQNNKLHSYYLPDGSQIELGAERFLAPEIMFEPSKVGLEYSGIHELANSSLRKSDLDLRKFLYSDILLAGGNTEITSFPERLLNELTALAPDDVRVSLRLIGIRLRFSLRRTGARLAGWEAPLCRIWAPLRRCGSLRRSTRNKEIESL